MSLGRSASMHSDSRAATCATSHDSTCCGEGFIRPYRTEPLP